MVSIKATARIHFKWKSQMDYGQRLRLKIKFPF